MSSEIVRVFEMTNGNSEKVNFVDAHNVVVGYDMTANCCEDFGWGVFQPDRTPVSEHLRVFYDYRFDTEYFVEVEDEGKYDQGGCVEFRMVNTKGGGELFLRLWNSHNGYYCHGFSMVQRTETAIHNGDI